MPISQARLKELAARSDEEIDYSDIPELDEAFFEKAKLVRPAAAGVPVSVLEVS